MTERRTWWLLGVLAVAFVVLTGAVRLGLTWAFDLRLTQLALATRFQERAWPNRLLTEMASPEVTGVVTAGLALWLWRTQRLYALALVGAFVLMLVVEAESKRWLRHSGTHVETELRSWLGHPSVRQAVDRLLNPPLWVKLLRSDPVLHNPYVGGHVPLTSSYPSGHMARTVLLVAILPALGMRRSFCLLAWLLVLLLALSRVATLAHWPSDVLGGVLLGWGLALGVRVVVQRGAPSRVQQAAQHSVRA